MESNWDNRLTLGTPHGDGDMLHNTRRLADGGFRKRGDIRRRSWNVYLVDMTLEEAYEVAFGQALRDYNERQIQQGRKSRCKTMQEWMQAQLTKKKKGAAVTGDMKRGYDELIIRYGNMFTACPYVYKTNDKGQMIDENGDVIPPWDTRKRPVPELDRDGKMIKSVRYFKLVEALKQSLKKFQETYPELFVIGASIHCDECGIHMHVDYIYCYKLENGIGLGCCYSTGLSRVCDRLGLKYNEKKRYDCGVKHWQAHVRKTLKAFMPEIGLQWIDGKQAGRDRMPQDEYEEMSDYKAECVEQREKKVKADERLNEVMATRNKLEAERIARMDKEVAAMSAEMSMKERSLQAKEDVIAEREKDVALREKSVDILRRNADSMMRKAQEKEKSVDRYADEMRAKWADKVDEASKQYQVWSSKVAEVEKREAAVREKEAKINALEEKQRLINEKYWIIETVLKNHPEWFKEARERYQVMYDNMIRAKRKEKGR